MIPFTCPCGKALHAKDEHAGQPTRCPECGRELAIPGGGGVQTADAPRFPGRPADEDVRRSLPDRPSGAEWEDRPLPAIGLGALGLWDIGNSQGRKKGEGLAITGIIAGLVLLLLLTVLLVSVLQGLHGEGSSLKGKATSDLKQIAIAMHSYHDTYGTFPPAAICDTTGKPLLSWRVAILPFIEQNPLYNQFKLDEPWDGPNNSKLLSQMPKIYALPCDSTTPPGHTCYRVFVGNGAAFDPPPPTKLVDGFLLTKGVAKDDFPDGTANTILVVEALVAVPWTKPDELPYDPNGPLPALGGHFRSGFLVALADGSVRLISNDVSQATLRNAITRNDGNPLGPDW